MKLHNVKKTIPLFKLCYGKNKLINVISCECINKCRMEYVIPHHNYTPLKFYTNLKCNLTEVNQKLGDCMCIDKCSASLNDIDYYHSNEKNA